jgi:sugar transferase (PEP-CTERM/EpsH1 system associated)
MQATYQRQPPLIAHVIFRLGTGGLENGLVNLLNNLPADKYRHAVICMTDYTDFRDRLTRSDVAIYCLQKKEGKDFHVYVRLWRLLSKIKPDVLHTRNLSALEAQLPGFLLGVKCRIHGEHGRDFEDLDGNNFKHGVLRKFFRLIVQRYMPMSRDLETWLQQKIGVAPGKISQIYNGVDMEKFQPVLPKPIELLPENFRSHDLRRIGTVGRQAMVKNPVTLLEAFIYLVKTYPDAGGKARLIMVGNGILQQKLQEMAQDAGVDNQVWLAGDRSDVAQLMQTFDIFVLPSLNEGISNTILEAMASGLPVIATQVGGNPELVVDRQSGLLVESKNPQAMAEAIKYYLEQPELAKQHGEFGRNLCQQKFSLQRMLQDYMTVYDQLIEKHG